MDKKIPALMFIAIGISISGNAQNRKMEISLKGSIYYAEYELKEAGNMSNSYVFVSPEITYYIKPSFGIGLNLNIPLSREVGTVNWDYYAKSPKIFNVGISAHFSTNREKRIRFHGTLGISYIKEKYTLTDYTDNPTLPEIAASPSGLAYSIGAGLGVRITRSVVFNLLDAKVGLLGKNFADGSGGGYFITFESGLILMFLKEK